MTDATGHMTFPLYCSIYLDERVRQPLHPDSHRAVPDVALLRFLHRVPVDVDDFVKVPDQNLGNLKVCSPKRGSVWISHFKGESTTITGKNEPRWSRRNRRTQDESSGVVWHITNTTTTTITPPPPPPPTPLHPSPRTASGGRKTCRPPPRTWAAPRCQGCTPPPLRGPCTPRSRCTGWRTGWCLGAGGCSCGCRRPVMRAGNGGQVGETRTGAPVGGWVLPPGMVPQGGGGLHPAKIDKYLHPLSYLFNAHELPSSRISPRSRHGSGTPADGL